MRLARTISRLALVVFILAGVGLTALPVSAATGTLTLSPPSGTVNSFVSVTGSGFTTGTTATFTLTYDSVAVATGTVTLPAGTISTAFAVPPGIRGTHTVAVTTSTGDSGSTAFTVTPEILIDSSSGGAGDTVNVTGTGFTASTQVTLTFDGTAVTYATTNTQGTFTTTPLVVPQVARGSHTIGATDSLGAAPSLTYTIIAKVAASPSTAAAGAQVSVTGSGFSASSTITFLLDTTAIATAVTSTSTGTFSATITVPAVSRGSHTLKAQDASGNFANTTLNVQQAVTIEPKTGPAGTSVRITGSGFAPSTSVSMQFNGIAMATNPSPVVTDSNGSLNATFTVTGGAAGTYNVVASDGTTSSTATFTLTASASINPVTGPVETTVTVKGTGFLAGGAAIIRYDNAQIGSASADATGSLNATFKVPPSAFGNHAVVVTDGTTTLTYSFAVQPTATLSATSGYVGSDVSVKGLGFGASRPVAVRYDAVQVATANSDSTGTVTASFKAPVSKGGNHTITITDNTNTITATFAMDSTPPPVPTLVQPVNLAKADALAQLRWAEVADPSGVVYDVQIGTDATFSTLVLDKKGLTTTGYTLVEKETLKSVSSSKPYYWRVKAIDGASNESAWSPPQTFAVGFVLPTWGLYVIFGVGALGMGVLGFWLGRRTAYF